MAIQTKTEPGPLGALTVEDLTRAIRNSIDRAGMKDDEARAMAQHVLNFFGYSERIIDNVLEPEDRDAFYMLEDSGIRTTEREETTLYDGREWRIHYWMFRKDRIQELVQVAKAREARERASIYEDVPEDVWSQRKKPEEEAPAQRFLTTGAAEGLPRTAGGGPPPGTAGATSSPPGTGTPAPTPPRDGARPPPTSPRRRPT